MNFWVANLILGSKNHLIEKKIDNSSNKMIVMWAKVLNKDEVFPSILFLFFFVK